MPFETVPDPSRSVVGQATLAEALEHHCDWCGHWIAFCALAGCGAWRPTTIEDRVYVWQILMLNQKSDKVES